MGKKGKKARQARQAEPGTASSIKRQSYTHPHSVDFARGSAPRGLCHHGFPNLEAATGITAFYQSVPSNNSGSICQSIMDASCAINGVISPLSQETMGALAAIGANLLLNPDIEPKIGTTHAHMTAAVICTLETWVIERDTFDDCGQRLAQKLTNLDSRKNLVSFFSQRISCNCLADEVEANQNDSTGMCFNCQTIVEDKKLFDCGCRIVKYCSRECQKEHRRDHRQLCKFAAGEDGGDTK